MDHRVPPDEPARQGLSPDGEPASPPAGDSAPPPDAVGTVGEPFALPLPAGAATGAEWRLELPDGLRAAGETGASVSETADPSGATATSATGIPGAPVDSLPLVVADAEGAYRVVAHLIRPWDRTVLRTVTLSVAVR
ncbi:hypothetical protein AAIB33_15255 [Microbacterium sp. AZCO]|uniref:protease inhibitor I42 family protein n=1 Tax=Microbacterium sp. AZCO TaxID=3142976 RepID=UPI0031F44A1F